MMLEKMSTIVLAFLLVSETTSAQNVGIGTTTPPDRLTIRHSGIGLTQESSNGLVRLGLYADNNVGAFLQTHSNHDLRFATNNSSAAMTLQRGTGNLGIGTLNPSARLHVNGSLRLEDGSQGVGRVLTSDANGNASWSLGAFPNVERFCYEIRQSGSNINTFTFYNIGTTAHESGLSSANTRLQSDFTFSRAGLYQFSWSGLIDLTQTAPRGFITIYVYRGANILNQFQSRVIPVQAISATNADRYGCGFETNFSFYVEANTLLSFTVIPSLGTGATISNFRMQVAGHFVAD